ncbi:stage III sporulation protein AA [Bacillus pinisoli]|uniref:stage III sporulation protein AA n=1 Tax=Bacillus pinisoli TaxID=2901866 RepID=UPI002342D368|nr:stage III sporulation protein AA [Bacillus pinisoli]
MNEIFELLSPNILTILNRYPSHLRERIEEIRLRLNRPLEIIIMGKPDFPRNMNTPYIVTSEDTIQLMNRLSQYSIYTLEEELKRGYITVQGGHRVGLAGKVITEKGEVKAIRDVTFFNIRIARQKIGIAESYLPHLLVSTGEWQNTMIIGPPQAGKTTLLRDLARLVSVGKEEMNLPSYKVGIVDERSEIAGCVKGVPQLELGWRVDVLDSCPKAEGMMMLIRSMSPDVIVVDEIGSVEDSKAIMEAVNAGVKLMVTAHGNTWADLEKRPSIRPLLELGIFSRFIILSKENGPGTSFKILDSTGHEVRRDKEVARW